MKKVIVCIGLLTAFTTNEIVKAQVVDVAANTQLAALNATQSSALAEQVQNGVILTQLLDYQEKIADALKKVTWLKNIKTIQQLDRILDLTICNNANLRFYLKFANKHNCFTALDFEMTLVNLDASLDGIYLVLNAGLSMSAGERLNSLNDAIVLLERSQRDIAKFNNAMRISVSNDMIQKHQEKNYGIGFSYRFN